MVINMDKTREYDQMIVDKIIKLIDPEYLKEAKIKLVVLKNTSNIIRVSLDVNPWRYGLINGDIFFARINSSGDNPSITFFGKFNEDFSILGMNYTEEKLFTVRNCINVDLNDFVSYLNNPTAKFIKVLNNIFISDILINEFGCCSKYSECEKTGKCLHIDQLYALGCQYKKVLKRTGIFE